MDDIDRLLSIKLYDVLDKVGVSEMIRKRSQELAIRTEIINTIKKQIEKIPCTIYIFGSHSEGTTIEGLNSDIDKVYLHKEYPVIDDIQTAPPRGFSYLLVRENHTYPGYGKLQLVIDGTQSTIFNTVIPNGYDTDIEGRTCQKHVLMCIDQHDTERHGPADSAPGRSSAAKDHDHVYAVRCRTIPKYAQTWLHRRRKYNWPSRDNLQKMRDLGCFVVGVGHSSSREQHIEWRMSFSLQERLLMFSLNPTQHKCYVLLKVIKNDIIKAEIGECLSSYHCKTCLFYAIEVTQAAIWRPENLMCCLRLCLMILLTWVVNGFCPNYFIPLENMFEKPQFRANRYRLLELLKAIIAEETSIILRMNCGDIRNRILQPGIVQNNMTDEIIYNHYLNLYKIIDGISNGIHTLYIQCSRTGRNDVIVLAKYIELFKNMRVIDEHSEQQTSDVISFVIPLLNQHIAKRLASFVCNGQCQDHARQLLYLCFHYFELANRRDLMTSRLLVVSLLLRLGEYDLCVIILEDIEHDVKRYIVTTCKHAMHYVPNTDLLRHLSTNNVSSKTAIRTVFVGCIIFDRSDTEIAPLPLQYEMYRSMFTPAGSRHECRDKWFDKAAVDGKVYLYFLQYLAYSRLNRPANKQVAIANLLWIMNDDPNLHHKETAYNLLGWIHIQEGRTPEALWCFVTSWKIRPAHNAAKWHLGIALYKYYTQ